MFQGFNIFIRLSFDSLFSDDKPILATEAVKVLRSVESRKMKALLGFQPKIKAEPYTAGNTGKYTGGETIQVAGPAEHHTNLLIAAVFISAFLVILVLVALLFLLHRAKTNGGLANKHRKLQGSPISGISGTIAGSSQLPSHHQSMEGSVSTEYESYPFLTFHETSINVKVLYLLFSWIGQNTTLLDPNLVSHLPAPHHKTN